ncbi:conjugal transfer protein [Amycolatopsis magusensis]|uniref:conjugal transfer protein n=1 Tax=Amycolatopsis magusensis TaxID=882444 RepID=UPI0024A7D1F9|nr:conjugal transfer protein [Amycolatopsis magusensis]MDI5979028.1 conjugal transfer protein [Amycolatopsis magusensis]
MLPDAVAESLLWSATHNGGRVVGWGLVVASPLVMLATLVVLRPSPPPAPASLAGEVQRAPAGWAEMYVRSWLSASREDDAGLEAFYPPGMKAQRAVGTQVPVETAAISTVSPSTGQWSVVVSANVLTQQPDGHHKAKLTCFQVSLLEQGEPPAYAAAALPSPVSCPGTLPAAQLAYTETAELAGPIGQSVLGFLNAYLTTRGGLERYIAPGAALTPALPAPYASVQLSELRTHERFEPGQAARPPDAQPVHVLARAAGYDVTGQIVPFDYALTLTARAGRWEVSRIDPAPMLATR